MYNARSIYEKSNIETYACLHRTLLYRATRSDTQLSMMTLQDLIETPTVLKQKLWDKTIVYPRYLYDSSATRHFSKEFYSWWKTYFTNDFPQLQNVKIRLVADTQRTLETYFIRKKPSKEILKKMETN